ncbi:MULTISPECIES: NAD(P)-binding domain-containing protein [Flavobacterium]|uniref:NAD(P)-binding domain-containing protein n=1 Tax=Flavobacterium TaxID=237 RepID=UPI001182F949|nr:MULTISPECIES: NAD(P)-binding domain-containing protein [Flavobacterium]MCR4033832.1 NAD(P)-binding domain-containing protein [Flavobacterium panacis]
MKIGIIGIGSLTLELTRRAAYAGYHVIVHNPKGNSLVRDSLSDMGHNIELSSIQKAAGADLVIIFFSKTDSQEIISDLPDMTGKIVIHTSGLIFNPQTLLTGLAYAMTYKITAAMLPTAHVVKLFKPIRLETFTNEIQNKRQEIFYIADHTNSRQAVKDFLSKLNFSAIDLSTSKQQELGYDVDKNLNA